VIPSSNLNAVQSKTDCIRIGMVMLGGQNRLVAANRAANLLDPIITYRTSVAVPQNRLERFTGIGGRCKEVSLRGVVQFKLTEELDGDFRAT